LSPDSIYEVIYKFLQQNYQNLISQAGMLDESNPLKLFFYWN